MAADARRFEAFIASDAGHAVMRRYGFFLGSDGGGCGGGNSGGGPGSEVDSGVDSTGGGSNIDAGQVIPPDADLADAPVTECTITVSGGMAASHVCSGTEFQHFIAMNTSNVNIGFSGGGVLLSASVIFDGDIHVGTFTINDAGVTGGIQVSESQPPPTVQWISDAAELGHGVIGSWSLTITSAIKLSTVGNNENYALHGTMTGTLPVSNPADPMNPPPDVTFFGAF